MGKTFDASENGWSFGADRRRPPYVLPFLYNLYVRNPDGSVGDYWKSVVKIASFDMKHASVKGMFETSQSTVVMEPGVDVTVEEYEFSSERSAMIFIRKWWGGS